MDTTNKKTTNGLRVHVDAQGHFFKLQVQGLAVHAKVGGQRGLVWEFSFASRKRMLERLARIDVEAAGFVTFVTLTYPDRDGPPTPMASDRDRQTFQKRVKRLYPEASAIWRREWEERKSGEFEGVAFPHYHYLFFRLPFLEADRLNTMWAEVLGWPDYVRTEIKGVRSWRQAFYYVAKYMAKPETRSLAEPPEGPGPAVREAGPAVGGPAPGSLVYGAYLTAYDEGNGNGEKRGKEGEEGKKEEGSCQSTGRSWVTCSLILGPYEMSGNLLF